MTDNTLAWEVGALLNAHQWSLAVAESCTGGLVGSRVTDVPGSSDYFMGGAITYSYEAKERVLGVSHETLINHGAVSEETAHEMAEGVRRLVGTDIGLAITGIAGPGGGMPQKPVGLVYIAVIGPDARICRRFLAEGDRLANKSQFADFALGLLRDFLAADESTAIYST